MTYFHRRMPTIIGAKAFHGPVRDGKGWDHLAMVVKRKRLLTWLFGPSGPIWVRSTSVVWGKGRFGRLHLRVLRITCGVIAGAMYDVAPI